MLYKQAASYDKHVLRETQHTMSVWLRPQLRDTLCVHALIM